MDKESENKPDDKFADLIKPLLAKYLVQLADRTKKLQAHVKMFKNQEPSAADCEAFRQLVHLMAGSGTTYGFPLITQYAALIDEHLKDHNSIDRQAVVSDAEKLLLVCNQALSEAPSA